TRHGQKTAPFSKKAERYGTLAFAKSLLNDQDWFEGLWVNKTSIENKPILFIWGMKDSFIGPSYLDQFKSGFTNASVVQLPGCGHFPQEEEAAESLKAMQTFLSP
ncbi:MAG: alpha/beta hydrolase, partial [Bacteroidota bacterium]|nr:alpha/beta hydrolase [Bacteroidota bacterium]MDX5429527.1 alpha/beta hydrolase [Bacteroidota bacterium]MDX5468314.1 alpha/beta hydrolase [Bacteroidota bacterium]